MYKFMWKNRNSRFYRLKRMRMTYARSKNLDETVKAPHFSSIPSCNSTKMAFLRLLIVVVVVVVNADVVRLFMWSYNVFVFTIMAYDSVYYNFFSLALSLSKHQHTSRKTAYNFVL